MLIGDTCFAMNKNLEYIGGEPFFGAHENAHFWRWLLTRLQGQPEWIPPRPPERVQESAGRRRCRIAGGGIVVRIWLATALLASAWLFGLGYFDPVNLVAWIGALAVAVLLLGDLPVRFPRRLERCLALLLLMPALWMVPLPYRSMPVLLFCGLAVSLLPVRNAGTRVVARGSVLASMILLPQALALLFYQSMTARAHELPDALAGPVAWLHATVRRGGGGGSCHVGSAGHGDGRSHRGDLGAVARSGHGRCRSRWRRVAGLSGISTSPVTWAGEVVLAQLRASAPGDDWPGCPLRLALLVTLVLQQQLRADVAAFPNVGQTLVSTWVHMGFVCVLAVVLSRLVPLPGHGLAG